MIKNYLRIAVRNMLKDKYYSFINVLGLVTGITSALFVLLYVWNEFSFDKFHTEHENIYHVALTGKLGEQEVNTSTTSAPVGPAMVENIPGVQSYMRINPGGRQVFRFGEKAFTEPSIAYVDSNFFEFFDFKLLKGDPSLVLSQPNSIVLNTFLAEKYFGEEDPVGKVLAIGNEKRNYTVTGVMDMFPYNSYLRLDAVMSISSLYQAWGPEFFQEWTNNSLETFVRKDPETPIASVNAKLDELVRQHVGPILAQFMGIDFDSFLAGGGKYGYWIYPMKDIRLNGPLEDYSGATGSMQYVYIFMAVGIFILAIACINFMNLSTARSAGRAKEVGIRKTMGSQRSQMIVQFISESILYSGMAMIVSLFLVYLLLPAFNTLAGVQLTMSPFMTLPFILSLIGLTLFVGFVAGSYPAFYLTAFSVVQVLKGKGRSSLKSGSVRNVLVVFQFLVSIVLVIGTAVVYSQLEFMQSRNLGFDKQHVINVNNASRLGTNQNAYRINASQLGGIEAASYTTNNFPGVNQTTIFKSAESEADYIISTYFTDQFHIDALGLKILKGRFFSEDFTTDSLSIVLNEAAVRQLGWESDPLGRELLYSGNEPGLFIKYRVIGVVNDFNFEGVNVKVRPLVIRRGKTANNLLVRYSGSPEIAIEGLKAQWDEMANGEPFEYTFMDDSFNHLFRSEQRLGGLFTVLSALAIFVACLGLFGLAAYMAEQRVKEIGIRKALGASTLGLTNLLTQEFIKLVAIAFVLSLFPAWYFLDGWLGNFAYRVEMQWWIFVLAGLFSFAIAYLTVLFQAVKAAAANPVKSLRYE